MTIARASTETQAANAALRRLGEPPISDIETETSKRARACRGAFGDVRDKLLRERDWNFATGWAKPAADPAPGPGPYAVRYPLPDDCLRVRTINGIKPGDLRGWAVEAAADGSEAMSLVTDVQAPPHVCYTRRIESPAQWDAEFLAAFARELAAEIATELARAAGAGAEVRAEAKFETVKAARSDARERSGNQISRDVSFVTARRGFYPGRR